MKFYKETTAWDVPNHVYLLSTDKSKMYGYIKRGSDVAETFKKPYRFDTRGRQFVEVKELGEIDLDQVKVESWSFTGSKNNTYVVQKMDGMLQCTCPGYTFRGNCKHVKEVEEL
jgi:uncharacterized Zn finger protein